MRRRLWLGVPLLIAACFVIGSGCGSTPTSAPGPTPPPAGPVTLVGAGDIAGHPGFGNLADTEATARVLDIIQGLVFTAGDNNNSIEPGVTYMTFDGTWGRHKWRMYPSPGNHDYDTNNGANYYAYFGSRAGPAGLGYYSYTAGSWHVLSLNSEVPAGPGSAQYAWLVDDLETNRAACTMAYWHRAAFTSGPNTPNQSALDLWKVMYQYGVDIVVNGHDHHYERFAPMDASGRRDTAAGVREFVVGTGGAKPYAFPRTASNSEVQGSGFGVIKLTLSQGFYTWEFVPVAGSSFTDSGSGACH